MGQFAKRVPTAQNVGLAIVRLKPAKWEEWRRLVVELDCTFEEYVIARIRRKRQIPKEAGQAEPCRCC